MYLHLFCLHTDLDQRVDFGNVQRFQLFILRDADLIVTQQVKFRFIVFQNLFTAFQKIVHGAAAGLLQLGDFRQRIILLKVVIQNRALLLCQQRTIEIDQKIHSFGLS